MVSSAFSSATGALMSMVNTTVAMTIKNMVNFNGDNKKALVALCAAMFAIVVWAVAAWWFGIPTSESHALIAGITGAAIALGGADGVNMDEWVKVIIGLFLSTILGFTVGFIIVKLVVAIFRTTDRRKTDSFFKGAQITGGAAMAFMHGAQDGQKFMGVFMLGSMLASGNYVAGGNFETSIWLMVLCSVVMSLGTSIGGYKIIKSVGMDMISLEKYQGFSADIAAALCLLLASLTGISKFSDKPNPLIP